jgi:hypothetical protein
MMVNCLDLSSIADIASGAVLITVCGGLRRALAPRKETKSSRSVIAIGFVLMAIVFLIFEVSVYHTDATSIALTAALVAASVLIEMVLARKSRPGLTAT